MSRPLVVAASMQTETWPASADWNFGVFSGAHDRATLARAPHTHLIGSVIELPELLFGL